MSHSRRRGVAALVAAVAGMVTCGKVFSPGPPGHTALNPIYLPLLLGTGVTGTVYAVLTWRPTAATEAAEAAEDRSSRMGGVLKALPIAIVIVAAIGALLGGVLYAGLANPRPTSGADILYQGALPGGFIGLVIGLAVAVPTILIVGLVEFLRKR